MSIGKSAAKMIINHKRERGARMAENLTGKARGNLWTVGQTVIKSRMTVQNNNAGLSLHCDYFFKMLIKQSLVLYAFFWVILRLLNFICRRFGTLCLFHLHRRIGMKND
jgi:hypothetical protein